MGTWMRTLYESPKARQAVPQILIDMGEHTLAVLFAAERGTRELSLVLGDYVDPIASVLERAAVSPDSRVPGPNTINFATAMRIYGPPEALRGEPLEWQEASYCSGMLIAKDYRGTAWDITAARSAFGVTIAQWDRPDWWVETLELAKTLVAEIVARPSFSRESLENAEIEIPFD